MEPGESAEQAVAREVHEEVGISVSKLRYVGSQPWPMPHSLMLGFRAEAVGGREIKVDADEIAEAAWYSRDELQASDQAARSCATAGVDRPPHHRVLVRPELTGAW